MLDDKLREAGAEVVTEPEPFKAHVVVDGRMVTGQNPASALLMAEAVVRLLAGGAA